MTKLKNKLYENRYGLFFFVFLMAYSFFVTGSIDFRSMSSQTYLFHIFDFSVGFCTKLLPGAICNLLFGDPTKTQVALYLTVLTTLCYLLVGLLAGKAFKQAKNEHRFFILILLLLFLTGPETFADYTGLDFYWIFASVIAIFCLQNRYTYILVAPVMLIAVMSHFAVIGCYVPFIAIIMLYKISVTDEKKDRIILWISWILLVVTTLGLSLYMVVYEVDNVKITMEELKAWQESKGIIDLKYYYFAFYRDEIVENVSGLYPQIESELIQNIDMNQSPVKIIIDMIMQQIIINSLITDYSGDLPFFLIILPVIIIVYNYLWLIFRNNRENKLKRFSVFCSAMLFFVSLFYGLSFSTDTIRWFAHAFTPLLVFFIYAFSKEDGESKAAILNHMKRIPTAVVLTYTAIYAVSSGIF